MQFKWIQQIKICDYSIFMSNQENNLIHFRCTQRTLKIEIFEGFEVVIRGNNNFDFSKIANSFLIKLYSFTPQGV